MAGVELLAAPFEHTEEMIWPIEQRLPVLSNGSYETVQYSLNQRISVIIGRLPVVMCQSLSHEYADNIAHICGPELQFLPTR